MTTARNVIFAAAFLLAASPAYAQHGGAHAGGGHFGGGRSGGGHSGGHSSSAHGGFSSQGGLSGRSAAVGVHVASIARAGSAVAAQPRAPAVNTFTRMVFVPPPRTASPVVSRMAPRGSVRAPVSSTRAIPSGTFVRPARHTVAVVAFGPNPILRRSTVVFFFGQPFFCPVFVNPFADPFFVDQFLADQFVLNPFCPLCATGRVPFFAQGPFFSPFFRRRFFSPFFPHHRFFFGGGFLPFDGTVDGVAGNEAVAAPEENLGEGPSEFVPPPGEAVEMQTPAEKAALPLTLLVLRDGSMYGVTDYWLENGNLHYLTNYGGENSAPLDRIDLDTTAQMNWERGNPFTLRPKPQQ